jgi:hypothetical protein
METTFNYCEAALWFIIAVVVTIAARKQSASIRRNARLAFFAFVVFGVSDLIEAQAGAWWRPWWLFALKAACVLGLLTCLRRHRTLKRRGN